RAEKDNAPSAARAASAHSGVVRGRARTRISAAAANTNADTAHHAGGRQQRQATPIPAANARAAHNIGCRALAGWVPMDRRDIGAPDYTCAICARCSQTSSRSAHKSEHSFNMERLREQVDKVRLFDAIPEAQQHACIAR